MAVIEMNDRELSRLRSMINLLDGGAGLQRPAFENRHGETAVLRDAEPQQGGTLRLTAKQARIQRGSAADARRCTQIGQGPACPASPEAAGPRLTSRADTLAPVPSACISVHLLLICVEILACFAARRTLPHQRPRAARGKIPWTRAPAPAGTAITQRPGAARH